MIDPSDKDGRYLAETRLEKLVEELHIDKAKIQGIQHESTKGNVRVMVLSAVLCTLSMVPYVFLNVKSGNSLPHHTRWTFPALRAGGGFLILAMMRLIIQRRITILARRWISSHSALHQPRSRSGNDLEMGPIVTGASVDIPQAWIAEDTPATDRNPLLTWFLLAILLLSILASVVGYVGCFSVVQSASGSTGPLSWLCLEAGLSLLRMFLWSFNPVNAQPLELILACEPTLPSRHASFMITSSRRRRFCTSPAPINISFRSRRSPVLWNPSIIPMSLFTIL
jgi:hypothetical protein